MPSYVDGDFTEPVLVSERPVYIDPGRSSRIAYVREYVQLYDNWTPTPINQQTDGELAYVTFEEVLGYMGPLVRFRRTYQTIPGDDPDNPLEEGGKIEYGVSSYTVPGKKQKKTIVNPFGFLLPITAPAENEDELARLGIVFRYGPDGQSGYWIPTSSETLEIISEPITIPVIVKISFSYVNGAPPKSTAMPKPLLCGTRVTQYSGWDYNEDGEITAVTGGDGGVVWTRIQPSGGGLTEIAVARVYSGDYLDGLTF